MISDLFQTFKFSFIWFSEKSISLCCKKCILLEREKKSSALLLNFLVGTQMRQDREEKQLLYCECVEQCDLTCETSRSFIQCPGGISSSVSNRATNKSDQKNYSVETPTNYSGITTNNKVDQKNMKFKKKRTKVL